MCGYKHRCRVIHHALESKWSVVAHCRPDLGLGLCHCFVDLSPRFATVARSICGCAWTRLGYRQFHGRARIRNSRHGRTQPHGARNGQQWLRARHRKQLWHWARGAVLILWTSADPVSAPRVNPVRIAAACDPTTYRGARPDTQAQFASRCCASRIEWCGPPCTRAASAKPAVTSCPLQMRWRCPHKRGIHVKDTVIHALRFWGARGCPDALKSAVAIAGRLEMQTGLASG